jgi:NADPH:quinone reductase
MFTVQKAEFEMTPKGTQKEAVVDKDISVQIVDSPIPQPAANQVLIKVEVSGTNPKDWKYPQW